MFMEGSDMMKDTVKSRKDASFTRCVVLGTKFRTPPS